MIIYGDCIEKLKEMMPHSVDALVTDPPAGIAFMGKDWDKDKGGRDAWISWMQGVMQECYRVMKPGAHGFVWALPRTSHWTATALENAGFEIRDIVTHVFGSGFPKSHNISKGIDKAAEAERAVISKNPNHRTLTATVTMCGQPHVGSGAITTPATPATPDAKQWDGWGTALKPASEHWILIRKPLSEKTVAKNVLKHGTGGINIDASRVGYQSDLDKAEAKPKGRIHADRGNHPAWDISKQNLKNAPDPNPQGRFPANFICSGEAREMLDEQSGDCKSAGKYKDSTLKKDIGLNSCFNLGGRRPINFSGETGGASRFFYCAKASKAERGVDNNHPTVKAQKLMTYLIKMITPPGGTVLDPFCGSGSTGVAATANGFQFVGIEQEKEYAVIAQKRIDNVDLGLGL